MSYMYCKKIQKVQEIKSNSKNTDMSYMQCFKCHFIFSSDHYNCKKTDMLFIDFNYHADSLNVMNSLS